MPELNIFWSPLWREQSVTSENPIKHTYWWQDLIARLRLVSKAELSADVTPYLFTEYKYFLWLDLQFASCCWVPAAKAAITLKERVQTLDTAVKTIKLFNKKMFTCFNVKKPTIFFSCCPLLQHLYSPLVCPLRPTLQKSPVCSGHLSQAWASAHHWCSCNYDHAGGQGWRHVHLH